MPITKSAKRALKKSLKRQKINRRKKEFIKKEKKDFLKLVSEKKTEEAKNKISQLYKILDKAAKTKLIKKNKANRLKSRLAKKTSS